MLTTAAAHLSPLVDWADLDGPFLDRERSVRGLAPIATVRSCCPIVAGLGVVERAVAA